MEFSKFVQHKKISYVYINQLENVYIHNNNKLYSS